MNNPDQPGLSAETIEKLGLRLMQEGIIPQMAPTERVFAYPGLEKVYVMENDLYGNPMPEGSCFLAFNGRVGLIGQHITIDALQNSTKADIEKLVADNRAG
jgi:hypothetical protein